MIVNLALPTMQKEILSQHVCASGGAAEEGEAGRPAERVLPAVPARPRAAHRPLQGACCAAATASDACPALSVVVCLRLDMHHDIIRSNMLRFAGCKPYYCLLECVI